MCGPVQLKTEVCVRRNGSDVGCAGKTGERQENLCVCLCMRGRLREREKGREGGAGASGLEPNANTAFGIRGGEGCEWFNI